MTSVYARVFRETVGDQRGGGRREAAGGMEGGGEGARAL